MISQCSKHSSRCAIMCLDGTRANTRTHSLTHSHAASLHIHDTCIPTHAHIKVFGMRAAFLDYAHYSTPIEGEHVLSIDEKWTSYHGKSTVICCNDAVETQRYDSLIFLLYSTCRLNHCDVFLRFDSAALLQRLSSHHAQGRGGAVISTPDFKIEVQAGNTRSIKTNMACFGMSSASNNISMQLVSGPTFFEMVRALISTRTVEELFEWLKAAPGLGPPLDMVNMLSLLLLNVSYNFIIWLVLYLLGHEGRRAASALRIRRRVCQGPVLLLLRRRLASGVCRKEKWQLKHFGVYDKRCYL